MANSKVVFGEEVLMDLTGDTIAADKLLAGITAHGADGEAITGTCTFDANTQDATAAAAEILSGKTAYKKGAKVTGTMVNKGAVNLTITAKAGKAAIPQGYHNGSGVTILGVAGTMSGTEGVKAQSKSVTPSKTAQTVLPDSNYNYLSQVTVAAIPYTESENSAGGTTVTIG